MSERMQLKDPGAECVMQVKTATMETVENTEYVKFDDGTNDLLVPLSSVERQLERLGADSPLSIAGMAVKFSRSTKLSKYGKPFWNLDVATAADLKAVPPSKRLASPAKDSEPVITAQSLKDDPQGRGEAYEPEGELLDAAEKAKADQKAAIGRVVTLYLGLWDRVAAHQVEFGKAHDFPVDGSSVNSAAATIFIELNRRGLLK